MMENRSAFGPDFIPGKVEEDKTAAAQALGRRWSDQPAKASGGGSLNRPPSTSAPGIEGASMWPAF